MLTQNCVTSGINIYQPTVNKPWNALRVGHLYRRMGFGATYSQLQAALPLVPANLVDQIVDAALATPLSTTPIWHNWTTEPLFGFTSEETINEERNEQRWEWRRQWLGDMLTNGFRDKLVLFWSNHFVTQLPVYDCSSYMYAYHRILQTNCLGNFKDFIYDIGIDGAMLRFLDGSSNTKNAPNENYARELYELFALGESNGYTEDDIKETARALTGWRAQGCGTPYFDPGRFDFTDKTIFGQTGMWTYDDVIDLLFEQRADQIADYICRTIYAHFVYPTVDETIVAELATTFKNNNFELAPVFRQLFKSDHFFDDVFVGSCIKSPVEAFYQLMYTTDMVYTDDLLDDVYVYTARLGQELFNPPDVSGWPGHRSWITEVTLTNRWDFIRTYVLEQFDDTSKANLVDLAKNLSGNSNDPVVITQKMLDFILAKPLDDANNYTIATRVLKGDIPAYYYDVGAWNLDWAEAADQLLNLLKYTIKLPEFQLC